ncbi:MULTISPECIES: metal ABC transporter ATP-binding protein [unclassified Sedimentibacter]|uniref:metal ABC transporter ATP-binding protein n=1 Tax=unclassified Sedimentibacter TaxID=2649220 RepID=UPI0027E05B5B|nr:ABC transporter ATP-binding protein [Sedimentibacter sp. MB35-C1]WMJ78030.1 ABC transporter ATP-binding protein [Sedimentibacter sp. MB35-C1]
MSKVIEAENLSFSYGYEPIFTKIGFSVYRGDFVAVIGSNGTGKSTLMRIMLGELAPTGGRIKLFNQDVSHFKDWPKVGYVPQSGIHSADSFPATAEEIVTANLFSQIGLMRFPKKKHRDKVMPALELVGMEAYSKRMISELSGGQRQRIMLARVLVNDPEIMLLDEPTTGVDTSTVKSLYELLYSLNRKTGLTIVMITHDIGRASNYVSRILCLEEGSLVELGKEQVAEELSHKHKHPMQHTHTVQKGSDGNGSNFRI